MPAQPPQDNEIQFTRMYASQAPGINGISFFYLTPENTLRMAAEFKDRENGSGSLEQKLTYTL